ncbi:hypothetical protein GA0115245_12182 [Streptomyces sp. di188]|nr:hypothetical protein GA0115245_12182 [Streptomyces sp. di188]
MGSPDQARARASHRSPLFGYTTTGLCVTRAATATAWSASWGVQQLTPTAITSPARAASANASSSGCPARVRPPAAEYDSQAGTPSPLTTRSSASASSVSGMVSSARTSGAAAARTSSRGRWNRSSSATERP